jgi:hypothetical protein
LSEFALMPTEIIKVIIGIKLIDLVKIRKNVFWVYFCTYVSLIRLIIIDRLIFKFIDYSSR